ncbi:pyrroline-5-carboxylate reductase [Pseudomonas fulva]|uniref:pyrroline-5-carboxylate reductase n=1 Tax=Pseudomonas fulva TaxID=47880 RepID=UPI00244BCC3B|nr:pyrroline-5-carboxylate reductase [Pseudomonas fulva]MDH0618908.1 pyrroline-5-carboxylate reductase [Pseudomonas fulva]
MLDPSNVADSLRNLTCSFLGGGNMACALISGLIAGGVSPTRINVCVRSEESMVRLRGEYGVNTQRVLDQAFAQTDVLVLAVKPQQLRDVLPLLTPLLGDNLIISLLAGVRLGTLERMLNSTRVVRAMPSTPALIREGVTGLVASEHVSAGDRSIVSAVAAAVGQHLWLDDDSKLDAVTAVSGSGPAYVFYLIEALEQAALALGLTPQQSRQLALATCRGSALLADSSSEAPETLRQRVTSKGGTTEAAVQVLDDRAVKLAFIEAISAAAVRSQALSQELDKA